MKTIWEQPLIQRVLRNRVGAFCWRPISPLYNAVLKHVVYRHGVLRDVGGGNIVRVCTENRRLRSSAQYAREIAWLLAAIPAGACVFDIGANIGLLSIIFGRKVKLGGQVFAFEPSPGPLACLRQNIALNNSGAVVHAQPYAVSSQDGKLDFFTNEDSLDTQHCATRPPGAHVQKIIVDVVSVDSFCRKHRVTPTVMKIDVEGYEPLVLEGARELISQATEITVFLELHPWVWPDIGYDEQKLWKLIADLGLHVADRLDDSHVKLIKKTR